MDPHYEQRLRDEVIYLHSLWYQGPPTNTLTPSQPLFNQTHANTKRVTGNSDWSAKKRPLLSDPQPNFTTTQWPCPNPVPDNTPASSSGWPAMKPTLVPLARQMSAEERASHSKLQLQYRALDTCREFFARKDGSESDEDDDELEDDDNGLDDEDDDDDVNKEYNFFLKMFSENNELRTYYEENSESSEFVCLVCEKGKNYGKKVKGCVALVQHSFAISKTTKKRAHRAFGQVLCRVMGWDIDRLPMIVLKGEPLGLTLAKTGDMQGELPEANTPNHEGFSGCVTYNAVALNVTKSEPTGEDAFGSHQKNDGEKLVTCEVSNQSLVSSAEWPCENPIENQGKFEENSDCCKEGLKCFEKDLNGDSSDKAEIIVNEDSDTHQNNDASKAFELQDKPEENSDCCKDGKVSSEKDLNSENGEVILKYFSDGCRDDDTSL